MIRIAKLPVIQEDTDRWGRPMGTYYVSDTQGEIAIEMWERIKSYENFYNSEEFEEDKRVIKALMHQELAKDNPNMVEALKNLPETNTKKIIDSSGSKSLLWQFNLRTGADEDESSYIRSYAVFGQVTLYEWTPAHNEKVKELQAQVDKMNAEEVS